jgi:hypothetical protein
MKLMKQLSIFLKNRPGTLVGVTQHLREAGINILGLSVSDTVDHAVVRLIVDEPVRALHLLGDSGILVIENDVIALSLANRPGQLSDLAAMLADNGVNIEYAYGGLHEGADAGIMFIRVSDHMKAADLMAVES